MTRSLENKNFRRYLLGHGLSNTGMWVQQTAELWLLLLLTGSGTAVGLHAVLRFGPVLLFGVHGGLLSDRIDRRKLLITTQGLNAIGAAFVATVAWIDALSVPLIYAVVLAQGFVNAIDNPLRRAFLRDMVSDGDLANAVSLHGSIATLTRAVGPGLAGLLIAWLGVSWCFTFNAISYIAVLIVLITLDRSLLRPQAHAAKGRRQLRAGFAKAWHTLVLRETLVVAFVVGIFGWNWATILPFYAADEMGGGASLYGGLVSILSAGAFLGALLMARRTRVGWSHLSRSSMGLAAAQVAIAAAPGLPLAAGGLFLLGVFSAYVMIGAQARLQLAVEDVFSGRVLALFSVAFVGSKPIGGLIGGWLTDLSGSRMAFGVSALAVIGTLVMMQSLSSLLRGGRPDHH